MLLLIQLNPRSRERLSALLPESALFGAQKDRSPVPAPLSRAAATLPFSRAGANLPYRRHSPISCACANLPCRRHCPPMPAPISHALSGAAAGAPLPFRCHSPARAQLYRACATLRYRRHSPVWRPAPLSRTGATLPFSRTGADLMCRRRSPIIPCPRRSPVPAPLSGTGSTLPCSGRRHSPVSYAWSNGVTCIYTLRMEVLKYAIIVIEVDDIDYSNDATWLLYHIERE